ncbi:MAG: response regulator [Acidobacteriota bacterium]|nr:response regulator [Acidobacteriota bacterium]
MTPNHNIAVTEKTSICPIDLGRYPLRDADDASTILVVDDFDIARRALVAMLRSDKYEILQAASGLEALEILSEHDIDLIVLDKTMPGMDGLECCRRIKSNRKTELVPVLMLTGANSVEEEIAGIRAGADQFLGKPIHPEVLRARATSLIHHKTAISRLEETESALFALAQAVELRDHCTGGHCERLATLSVAFGVRLGLPRKDLLALHRGGYLHDIGKIGLADSILFKTGDLDWAERKSMQTHTLRGEEICRPLRSLAQVLPIIRSHHEHWDGSGYPDNLAGEDIPMLARVMQLADVYDALTTERPYKSALGPSEAAAVILDESDRGWYDPELTRCFIDLTIENGFSESLWNIRRQFSGLRVNQLACSSSAG